MLLPEGWDAHPKATISAVHLPRALSVHHRGLRETPPDPNLKPDYSERFRLEGYNRIAAGNTAHEFYKDWTGPNFPRVLVIEIQHANPFYDDSYAVNSANLGPYGDAIVQELLPYIEKKYRGLGQGWARFMYGGSTGGWEAMAAQVFYPDEFNGSYARARTRSISAHSPTVDIYKRHERVLADSPWKKHAAPGPPQLPRPRAARRSGSMNRLELVLGTQDAVGPAVGHLGGGLLARSARTATRRASGTSARA